MSRSLALLLVLAAACGGDGAPGGDRGTISLTSPAFGDGGAIPLDHGCEGANVSPALQWSGVPGTAAELVLVLRDPDAGGFVHWIVVGIDPGAGGMAAGEVPQGASEGVNGFGGTGYGGPCPPDGETHTYELTLYALRQAPSLAAGVTIEEVEALLAGSTLAFGTLRGTYGTS
ncbi:MAG TPA: YbhB/YbcL family Raf kinase inhibitor-like protein [Actinomycetota bacterium]